MTGRKGEFIQSGVAERISIENRIQQRAQWFAGLIEAGGSMGYDIYTVVPDKNKKGYTYAFPKINFEDNDPERVQRLQTTVGCGDIGSRRHVSSSRWRVMGSNARIIAEAVQPYTPSRAEFMTLAVDEWSNLSPKDRLVKAKNYNKGSKEKKRKVQQGEYVKILSPEFVAGVIDARGVCATTTATRQRGDVPITSTAIYINVTSTNKELLQALKNTFGGTFVDTVGPQTSLGNAEKLEERAYWRIEGQTARKVYEYVRPHLVLRAEQAAQIFAQPQSPAQ